MTDERTSYVGKFDRRLFVDSMLFGRALVLTIAARLSLSIAGYPKTAKRFRSSSPRRTGESEQHATWAYRAAWAVSKASRIVKTDKPCLAQSIVLRHILASDGIDSEMKIGVKKADGGSINAHAWVEKDGEVLIGGGSSPFRYTVLKAPEQMNL